ncbi:hypothetical protein ACJZ2D_000422 [Fusarium nematophilum]
MTRTTQSDKYWTPNEKWPSEIVTSVPGSSNFSRMGVIHTAMKACPSITSLCIRIAHLGCFSSPDRWNFPLDLAGSDVHLSSPEVLELERFDFSEREWDRIRPPWQHWPRLRTFGFTWDAVRWWMQDIWAYPLELIEPWCSWIGSGTALQWWHLRKLPQGQKLKTNLQLWMDTMDFSKVRRLAIKDPRVRSGDDPLFIQLPKTLLSLRGLALWGSWGCHCGGCVDDQGVPLPSALTFILSLPPNSLTHLTWLDSGACSNSTLRSILEHHGSSLTSFEWRHSELKWQRRPAFTTEAIRSIGALAPNISRLVIDLNRDGCMPYGELGAIAESFPELTRLTIYMELADRTKNLTVSLGPPDETDVDLFKGPKLTESECLALFSFLKNTKIGSELISVQVRAGDWTRPFDGGVRSQRSWLEQRMVWFECGVQGEGVVFQSEEETFCQELELERRGFGGRDAVYTYAELADGGCSRISFD